MDIHVKGCLYFEGRNRWFLLCVFIRLSLIYAWKLTVPPIHEFFHCFMWNILPFLKLLIIQKKSMDKCALNIIHYISFLWSGITLMVMIKGWLKSVWKLPNHVIQGHNFFSTNIHFLTNSPGYLEEDFSGVTF